jgi:5-formaminoimidazole-4-carboxamide-1-(beta)-D-ribofuranosyl 5'-monophosphate synthetase
MLDRDEIIRLLDGYKKEDIRIGMIASHSALDVCDGAVEEGFFTVAVCEGGRDEPYTRYFKAFRDKRGKAYRGMVDQTLVLDKFGEVMSDRVQQFLRNENVVFVPNRSFSSYCDIGDIEDKFSVPLYGSRNLLRTEERGEKRNYYWLLEKAGIPFPEEVEDPDDIDGLVMVKLPHKVKRLERGFFTAATAKEFRQKSEELIKQDVISRKDLKAARIEKYVIGPVFNFDFFYSPLAGHEEGIELLGIDWRFETSLDGHVRLPASQQLTLNEKQKNPVYIVIGHNAATLRESSLNKIFPIAEKFVKATQEHYPPGIIGPFTLQTCVGADEEFCVFDVAPRIGGGTNVHMWVGHPYGNSLWRTTMSTGRRVAREIRRGIDDNRLDELVT